ncbi:hypothetical protein HQ496_04405 [bacterium]|nr:hypothetical protein [bacterium]
MSESNISSITGTVKRVEIEGGFWGIESSTGDKFVPLDPLAPALRTNGLAIQAEVELVTVFSVTMWGKHVRVHSIQAV